MNKEMYSGARKNKIERFFKPVRDQFLKVLDQEKSTSLEQLNSEFKKYVWTSLKLILKQLTRPRNEKFFSS